MKLFKSLLLGSAAGLIAVSGASAADLGVKKPAPVEYVKVCSAQGAGFFYVPGSDVCMKIGGFARAEVGYGTTYLRADDATAFRAYGRINVDTRQATQYGLLRTFLQVDMWNRNGRINSANGFAGNVFTFDRGFIQFYTGTSGFITAGRATSFFDFLPTVGLPAMHTLMGSDTGTNLFAYTATFGGGFTATLAVEDSYTRRQTGTGLGGMALAYGGQRMPDVVANLRVDQGWGSFQLSGALHQMFLTNRDSLGNYFSAKTGYAIQAGLKVNLPMLAAGDFFALQAAYGDGAINYVLGGPIGWAQFGSQLTGLGVAGGSADGYVNTTLAGTMEVSTSKAWQVSGFLAHNFTPSIVGYLYGGYANVNYSGTANNVFNPATGANGGVVDFNLYQVGAQVRWSPVKNFYIGAEAMYNVLDPKGRVLFADGSGIARTRSSIDSTTVRLRFHRDF